MEKIHIVFGFDHNYVIPCGVTILSICENNDSPITFHALVDTTITPNDKQQLESIASSKGNEIVFHLVERSAFDGFPEYLNINVTTFYRFLIPAMCPQELDRIIYLDTDLIVRKPLDELWNMPLNDDTCVCAAIDYSGSNPTTHNAIMLDLNTPYCNAGVLLINLKYWRTHEVARHCLDYVQTNRPKYLDQDALNALYHSHITRIHSKFNLQSSFQIYPENEWEIDNSKYGDQVKEALQDPVIIHYTTIKKPWKLGYQWPNEWTDYYHRSPWKELPLEAPKTKAVFTRYQFDKLELNKGYWLERLAPAYLTLLDKSVPKRKWAIIMVNRICKLLLKII